MAKHVEINVGDKYGRLTIIEEVEPHYYPSGERRRKFLMQCDCGSAPKTYLTSSFRNGTTVSCGCYNKEKRTTHGMYETRQYQCWADMKTRCDCKENKFYDYYGGRGISYCDKWKTFEGFWEDMQDDYSDDLTINRRDNDKGYSKDNCRWDTKSFQGHMRRKLNGTIFSVIGATESEAAGKINASIRWEIYNLYLGSYETEQEVAEAYDQAAQMFYGDRPNKTIATRPEILENVEYYFANKDVILRPKGSEQWNAKLTDQDVIEIFDLLRCKLFRQVEIADMYSVNQATISGINRGQGWTHLTKATRVHREKLPFGIGRVFKFNNGPHFYWCIHRTIKGDKPVRKTFSVTKLGDEDAYSQATRARQDWIEELTQLKETNDNRLHTRVTSIKKY